MAADEADALLLSQTHFAETIDHVRLGGQLLDANHGARLDMREWAGCRIGAAIRRCEWAFIRFFHCSEASSAA